MKFRKADIITTAATVGLVGMAVLTPFALAQVTPDNPVPGVQVPGGAPTTVGGLVDRFAAVVRWVYIIFFTVAVLLILFAAFTYLTAAGDEEKIKRARDQLIYAAVAIVVALLAVGFRAIIENFLRTPTA
ncbi:hypothetical protein HY504_03075 [Candidatus Wolfebacteria bacterium]|nr:hypothetical protein [Candidatus Wolfebacteria bacterium]